MNEIITKSNEEIIQEAKSALVNMFNRFTPFSKLYDKELSDDEQINVVKNKYDSLSEDEQLEYCQMARIQSMNGGSNFTQFYISQILLALYHNSIKDNEWRNLSNMALHEELFHLINNVNVNYPYSKVKI